VRFRRFSGTALSKKFLVAMATLTVNTFVSASTTSFPQSKLVATACQHHALLAGSSKCRGPCFHRRGLRWNLDYAGAGPTGDLLISPTDVFTANLFTNPVTVKITGTGFVAATVAHVDGLAEPTAFTSAQQMTVSVPVSVLNDFSNFGRHQIAAVNPNGDTSNSVQFSVVPLI
jgi:hypothetical protein